MFRLVCVVHCACRSAQDVCRSRVGSESIYRTELSSASEEIYTPRLLFLFLLLSSSLCQKSGYELHIASSNTIHVIVECGTIYATGCNVACHHLCMYSIAQGQCFGVNIHYGRCRTYSYTGFYRWGYFFGCSGLFYSKHPLANSHWH